MIGNWLCFKNEANMNITCPENSYRWCVLPQSNSVLEFQNNFTPKFEKKKFIPPLKSYYFILLPNDIGSSLQNFVAITLNQKSYNKKFVIAQCGVSIMMEPP